MQYNEHQLAQLAATVAAGLARGSDLGAHCAALKVDELELLYDDADFL